MVFTFYCWYQRLSDFLFQKHKIPPQACMLVFYCFWTEFRLGLLRSIWNTPILVNCSNWSLSICEINHSLFLWSKNLIHSRCFSKKESFVLSSIVSKNSLNGWISPFWAASNVILFLFAIEVCLLHFELGVIYI